MRSKRFDTRLQEREGVCFNRLILHGDTGRLAAVCMRATNSGDGVSEVISQATPTLCIHVPMLDTTVAIQIARKRG